MINNRIFFKKIIFAFNLIILSFSIYADGNGCNTDAILSVMSDREMDKFKDKLCVHYFANEFVPQELSMGVCQNIVMNCRPTIIDFSHQQFPGKNIEETISEDMIDFLENVQQVNLIEEKHGKEIGNVEFFRAIKESLSKEELAEIPNCPEMKEFSNISECLVYEGMTEDDASFLQNYANAGRIELLTNEFSEIRDVSIMRDGEKLSEEKRDALYRRMGVLGKKIDESIMHNGMKNIDYKNADLLLEKLTPFASNLSSSFDGESSAISIFESFLPGYNLSGQKMSQKKVTAERQTDLILGYWWQMKVELGQRPSEELENFFKDNPVNNGNLKEVLHKLRLKMAKEHATEACSESSRKRQKEFNDQGGACSIMGKNRKSGKINYQNFDDFAKSLANLSDGLKDKFSTEKREDQKILYNHAIANKICSNKVEMMGPFQDSRPIPQKFRSDSWKNIKKDIQEDLNSKQERSQTVLTSYRDEFKKNSSDKSRGSLINSEIKKLNSPNDLKSELLGNKEAIKNDKTLDSLKPKVDGNLNPNNGNKNYNNFFGNNFSNISNQPTKPTTADNSSSKIEREIESRLKALDEQINTGRQNLAKKDSTDEESLTKDRVNLDQLLKERASLQNSLQELVNAAPKVVKKVDNKSAVSVADEDEQPATSTVERSSRKVRDAKTIASGSSDSSSTSSADSAVGSVTESKSPSKNNNTGIKTDFGLVLTKAGDPVADLNQIAANPSESELVKLAEKTNGEPFLINENGEVVRVLVKKDAKGKLIFEKVKLTNEQKKKLAVKKDTVRSIKEIGTSPIRKMELDKLMKETR